MRQAVIIALVGFVCLVVLAQSGMFEALMLLLLMGVVPGTSLTIPSSVMLLAIIGVIWLIIFRFIIADTLQAKHLTRLRAERKKRTPNRRFSQI